MHFAFRSEGEGLVGNLFVPERGDPAGVVVSVGPLTSVKEQAAGIYARAMAERGYAALAFDYRCFGESDGQPRQFEDPEADIQDIRNAAGAVLADERLSGLPLFGLGVCFGAGPMVPALAKDARFRAFAGVAGVYTDGAKTREMMGDAYQAAIERGCAAERTWQDTGQAETIPAVAPDGGDVAMPLREAYEYYGTPRGQVPNYVNRYALQSSAYTLPSNARGAADTINVPVLMVHSEQALARTRSTPPSDPPNSSAGSTHRARSTSTTTPPSSPQPRTPWLHSGPRAKRPSRPSAGSRTRARPASHSGPSARRRITLRRTDPQPPSVP